MATATSDANGTWSIDHLYRGSEYVLSFSKNGYVFSEDKTIATSVATTIVDTLASDSAYDDEVIVLSANTDSLQFGSERSSAELHIVSNAAWTITTDVSWLTFSTEQGTGNSWIVVTAESNADAEAGSEDRTAIITVEEVPTATRAAKLMARGSGAKATTISASQNSPIAAQMASEPFDGNKYTGAPVNGYHNITGNLTIDKEMDLSSGSLNVSGDVSIKAPVNFGANGELVVGGKLTVSGNGILNMQSGGSVIVEGDFVFDPSKSHEGYLQAGEIEVGGNVNIKQKFYAGSGNRFTVKNNGKKHTINMWDKWIQKDQYFGTFIAEPDMSKLVIKESFDATTAIWNFQDLNRYHTGYAFQLAAYAGGSLSIDDRINSRIQSGMLQLIGKYGKSQTKLGIEFIDCQAEDYFSYIDSAGNVSQYYLELNMHQYVISSLGFGTGRYSDDEGHSYMFTVTSAYDELDTVMKDFSNWKNKLIKDAIKEEIKGIAIDAATSLILDIIPIGRSTKEITKAMKDNATELNNLYSILSE